MMSGDFINRESFSSFQQLWSLDKVKAMRLNEYTGIGGKKRNDFTYAIAYKKEFKNLVPIVGHNSSNFGIYRHSENNKKGDISCEYLDGYAWLKRYGQDKDKAFEKIKSSIIQIIEYSQTNQLHQIDKVDLGHAYKWKIAFHYQNADDMKIVCIFNDKCLQSIASGENLGQNLTTSQIYQKLLGNETYSLEKMIKEKARPLWSRYRPIKENK